MHIKYVFTQVNIFKHIPSSRAGPMALTERFDFQDNKSHATMGSVKKFEDPDEKYLKGEKKYVHPILPPAFSI